MKNAFLTFLCAFVPGAGQMYQGYMKRGLSLITLFCAGILAYELFPQLLVLCFIVWMYSFFDTFNLRAKIAEGTAGADAYIIATDPKLSRALGEKRKLLGWALVVFGVMVFYQEVLMNTVGDIVWRWGQNSAVYRAIYLVLDSLPDIFICVALVVCGVWLVRGSGSNHKADTEAAEETAGPDAEMMLEELCGSAGAQPDEEPETDTNAEGIDAGPAPEPEEPEAMTFEPQESELQGTDDASDGGWQQTF